MSTSSKAFPIEALPSVSSYEDINSFTCDWLPRGLDWIAATVHRFDGLLLVYEQDGKPFGVRFPRSLCGYYGSGSLATAEILALAGFGDKDELLVKISDQRCESIGLTKDTTR